mgnify:CR=1 FL=1
MSSSTSFQDSWYFPNELKKELGASGFDINDTPENFSTGRPRLEAVFYTGEGHNRKVIERRTAMRLISKKTGKPYEVVSRKPDSQTAARQPAAPPSQPAAPYTLDDVINA